ncbi:MAG: GAF domain-containing protein, partial [Chitinophagaceae bacterium]
MHKINLRNILIRKKDAADILQSLAQQLNSGITIEDTEGNILFHYGKEEDKVKCPVKYEDGIVGWVKGDENASLVAGIVSFIIGEETGRKEMGKEVLNLYKEINLIFNFSDKLANTIDVQSISKTALEEAGHVIEMDYGIVILWSESKRVLQVETVMGEAFFEQETINKEFELLRNIVFNGQSEITEDLSMLKDTSIIPSSVRSLMYSALRVRHRIMGAIILGSDKTEKYNAASLKLLTSLALQSSSAIESSLLFEKNIREAKEREEALHKVYDATAKFVPRQFISSLGREDITEVKLGDQVEKIVTVMFTDIRNYTGLSEQMTPEETFGFISA